MDLTKLIVVGPDGTRYKLVELGNVTPPGLVAKTVVINAAPEPLNSRKRAGDVAFGALYKQRREAASLSQVDVARESNIRQPNIANIEAGRRTPTDATRNSLIEAFEELSGTRWE